MLSKFYINIANLEKQTTQVGTTNDTNALRLQMRRNREENSVLAKTIMTKLKEASAIVDKDQRPRYSKLVTQFNDGLGRCEQVTKLSVQKERAFRMDVVEDGMGGVEELERDKGPDPFLQVLQERDLGDVDAQIIQETNIDMKGVEEDLTALSETFRDVGELVVQQGSALTFVETNAAAAHGDSGEGVRQLDSAYYHSKASRKKSCAIIICVIITLVIVAIVVGVVFAVHK